MTSDASFEAAAFLGQTNSGLQQELQYERQHDG